MKALSGHFDGKYVVLDEPARLAPNTKVTVIAAHNEKTDFAGDCAGASEAVFNEIRDNSLDADYDKL